VSQFVSLIISGAVAGALYAIVASGLVLTYQTSGILNFAHGAAAFATAYLFYVLRQPTDDGGLGLPIVLAVIIAVFLFAPLLGWFLDRVMLRKLAAASETARVVATVGLLVATPALVIYLVERLRAVFRLDLATNEQVYNPPGIGPRPKETWVITRGVAVDSDQVAVLLAAAVAAAGLWFMLRRTRLGLETRAGVDHKALAQLRGVDTDRVGAVSWMLSFFLAGLAGVLIAPLFDLEPLTYNLIVFAAFTAVVFAGLRSVPLAFAGGLLLGVAQNLVYGYAPNYLTEISGFRSVLPFALLLLFLLVLSRRGIRAAGSTDEERPPADHRKDLSPVRRRLPWAIATGVLALYVVFAADDFWASLTARGLALGLIFLSFVIVTGIGGMISLAQATFVTAGAFMAGWLVNHQWPQTVPVLMDNGRVTFVFAALAGAAVAAVVGVLVALPSLRLGGLALALATLALAFIGDRLVFQLESVRSGSSGWSVAAPEVAGVDFGSSRPMAIVLLAMCLLVALAISNLVRSPSGRAMLAVRSTDAAARAAGISPVTTKLGLFAVSAAIAGFGGAMYAAVASPFTNTTAPAIAGVIWLAVTVTFGVRRPAGAVIAGLAVAMFPSLIDWLTSSTFAWTILFLLAAGSAFGYLLAVALDRVVADDTVFGEQLTAGLLAIVSVALVVAAVTGANPFLYLAAVAAGLLAGLPSGAHFAAHPSAASPIGMLVFVSLFAAPQIVTWSRDAEAAGNAVADVIGSTQVPMILFGLGAIGLAANPNGILAGAGEQLAAQRRAQEHTARARREATPAPGIPDGRARPQPGPVPAHVADPADDSPAALRVEGLVGGWGDVEVLHGVDLEVASGTLVALLGANGAGKSTLCSVVGGVLPAMGGRVLLLGQDMTAASTFRRARAGMFLIPEGRGIFPSLAVEENLSLWLRSPEQRERAYERFPLLGERRTQPAGLLSGGERQMLALAPALEHPPRVLIADEPTLGLAPLAVEAVFRALVELRDRGVALLLVEEKARGVLDIADSVALMELGQMRWTGPRDATDADRLAAAYLGT
jgi:branched-subunit amino acid ABC-type transport system permease component/ABC-type branched-subunit amino acid transport system ATPase component